MQGHDRTVQQRDRTVQERDRTVQQRDRTVQERDPALQERHPAQRNRARLPLRRSGNVPGMRLADLSVLAAASLACATVAAAPSTPDAAPTPKPAPRGALETPLPNREPRGLLAPSGALGPDVYRRRRQVVLEKLGKAATVVMNEAKWDGDRSGMDFYWLTGFDEPGAALVLAPSEPVYKERLFLAPLDVEGERWTGERAELPSRALEVSTGIASVTRITYLPNALLAQCERSGELAYVEDFTPYAKDAPKALEALRKTTGQTLSCKVNDLHGLLGRLREVKSPEEIALMKKAITFTAEGFKAAVAATRPGAREYDIKDAVEDAMRRAGSRHVAYDTIVGSGPNGAVLHYPKDDRVVKDGDLVVIDAGAEADFYAADVTRTYPASGHFTKEHREIYDAVLRAQAAGLAKVRAGATMGEIADAVRESVAASGYNDDYMHSCCHFVGLEVHDAGDYNAPLPENAVITVEPGIYLSGRAMGVRIEDDVLVTKTGYEILSKDIPKEPAEVERLLGARR